MLKKIALATAGLAIAATTVFAGSHSGPFAGPIKARQSHMQLQAFNLGILGGMAQGKMDYDADAASAAASNLVVLTKMNPAAMWPQGSDADSVKGSRALAKMWQDFPGVMAKGGDLAAAATAMETAAGTDLASLQGAMKALGGACGACHKAYRQPE